MKIGFMQSAETNIFHGKFEYIVMHVAVKQAAIVGCFS